jgi:hypothetical protein
MKGGVAGQGWLPAQRLYPDACTNGDAMEKLEILEAQTCDLQAYNGYIGEYSSAEAR